MARRARREPEAEQPVYTQDDELEVASLLADETNPWTYMEVIKNRVPLSQRPPYFERWRDLVTARPLAEQDALVTEGQPVFRYSLGTIRESLKTAAKKAAGDVIAVPTLATDDFLAEMIYRPGETPSVGFLVHQFKNPDAVPEFVEKIKWNGLTYLPLAGRLAETRIVLFPTQVEDYGTDYGLFERLRDFVSRMMFIANDAFRDLACCYVLMSWVYDCFEAIPYLRAQGDFGSGKTRLLQTIGSLCYRPAFVGGSTTASPIFRLVEKVHGTLIIDEADFDKSDLWTEITKILNAGYMRGFPVLRSERDAGDKSFDVKAYDCYSPKILASRRRFSDVALESRCLTYVTTPMANTKLRQYPLVFDRKCREEAEQLRNRLLWWRFQRYKTMQLDETIEFPDVELRVMQIIQPLLSSVSDAKLRRTVMSMTVGYNQAMKQERAESLEGATVTALLRRWLEKRTPPRLLTREITAVIREGEDFGNINARKVGDILRRVLQVELKLSGGASWVYLTKTKAIELNAQYSLGFDEVLAGLPDPEPAPPVPVKSLRTAVKRS